MSKPALLSVGYEIPGLSDSYLSFTSERSLMDADVILFQPIFDDFNPRDSYMGKPSYDDDDSALVTEHCKRWRTELAEAIKTGKTVVVFLPPWEQVYVHSGRKGFSGSGRNRAVTRYVEELDNYSVLPFHLGSVVPKGGEHIRATSNLGSVASYWSEFGPHSTYHVYLKNPKGTPILTTRTSDAVVGLIYKSASGTAVLLPPVEYDEDAFTTTNNKGDTIWTKEGVAFGKRLMDAFLELDRALQAGTELTATPDWAKDSRYRLKMVAVHEEKLKKCDDEIVRWTKRRREAAAQLADVEILRGLLYETGKPLERAIQRALEMLGFVARPFHEDGSEFDVVFTSREGRFVGEAEGKNNRAIGVEKLDQLERNIREDFARKREDESSYAKGVLFGNAYRLKRLGERPEFFTVKCRAAADRGNVALVRTPDLFLVVQYLNERRDKKFAAACRDAIVKSRGEVVVFPDPG